MATAKFSIGEALRFGWETTKKNLWFFAGLVIVVGLISLAPNIINAVTGISKTAPALHLILVLTFNVVNLIIMMGLIKIWLKFCDNQKGSFSDLFSCVHLFFKLVGATIVYLLIILGGLILLIVPGIIWSIQFGYYAYLIVDKNAGPIQSLKMSSKITRGSKWNLFVFGLATIGIMLLGLLTLLVGTLVAMPVTSLAGVFVYRKLLSSTEPSPAPQAS